MTDTMRIGSTAAEANGYAFNLDNDRQGIADNVLGGFLTGLPRVIHFDSQIAAALNTGEVVILHSLHASSLRGGLASWRVYLGAPTPDPLLTGGGSFAIDPGAPSSTALRGLITRGQFTSGPGTVPLRLGLLPGQPPVELHLAAARVQANCDADGCSNGKLGGGVSATEVDTSLIPVLAAAMQAAIDASCTISTPDTCSDAARRILDIFDANHDYQVTADELRANIFIGILLAPDLDLLNADGQPGQDGVAESLSLGLGFTAKRATFDAPGEL